MAPAVDAHLKKLDISNRALADILAAFKAGEQDTKKGATERTARRLNQVVQNHPTIGGWMNFARSYGLPDEAGVPQRAVGTPKDGWNIADGATISGRENKYWGPSSDYAFETGLMFVSREQEMLKYGTTYYVSAEVVDEISAFAAEAEPEMLFETDLMSRSGFAVLEKVIQVPDLDPNTGAQRDDLHVQLRAIGWHMHDNIYSHKYDRSGPGVTLFIYTSADDYRNGYAKEYLSIFGGEMEEIPVWEDGNPFHPIEVIPWQFGCEWQAKRDVDIVAFVPGFVPDPVALQRRWFLAFMRLMWQEIIVRHNTKPLRGEARRWERAARTKPLLDYTTLRLRRIVDPQYAHATGTGVPLNYQVLVRAHPRRQWFRSLGPARLADGSMNPDSHRLIWIEAHIRGPEDARIVAKYHPTTAVTR
jgi:hypothetical protein